MPSVGQGSITVHRPTPRASTLSEFRTQLADPSRAYVRAPLGSFVVSSQIVINRRDVVVDMKGFHPVVPSGTAMVIAPTISDSTEKQATGVVTSGSNTLTLVSGVFAATVQVGHMHLIKVGVNWYDPQEPKFAVRRIVTSIVGLVVTYDEPFGLDADLYDDYADILTRNGGNWEEKLGPWGTRSTPNNWFRRGLGTDHGILVIDNPVVNVDLNDYSVEYEGDETIYAANALVVYGSRDVRINDMRVHNPRSSVIHWFLTERCIVNGLTITGVGSGDIYNQGFKTTRCNIITGWSAHDCEANRVVLKAIDCSLMNLEAGNTECRFNQIRIKNVKEFQSYGNSPHFGVYGPGSVIIDDISFEIPDTISSRLFPAGLANTIFRGFKIVTPSLPSTFIWGDSFLVEGEFRWGDYYFSAPETVVIEFTTIPNASPPNLSFIPYPPGIIMQRSFTVATRTGISHFSTPDLFGQSAELTFSATYTQNEIQRGVTYPQYQATISNHYVVATQAVGITMTLRIMRLLED